MPRYEVDIFWSEEDGGFIANVPELPYPSQNLRASHCEGLLTTLYLRRQLIPKC